MQDLNTESDTAGHSTVRSGMAIAGPAGPSTLPLIRVGRITQMAIFVGVCTNAMFLYTYSTTRGCKIVHFCWVTIAYSGFLTLPTVQKRQVT